MAVTYRAPGVILTEREHRVPLNHHAPDGREITVFTREVAAVGKEDKPYLVFFQGGPGFEAARPSAPPTGWQKRALEDFRLLLLDQRGTGRSTPLGDIPGDTPEAQAEYLTHFRADSIVRDAEHIRKELGVDKWAVLGQSFGGFCVMTYLSFAPEGLSEAYVTGGLAPIGRPVDEVYAATYARMVERNRDYFGRYPGDRARVREIVTQLEAEDVRLPNGDRLTSRRFLQVGHALGMSYGNETVHHLLELPVRSRAFLHDIQSQPGFARNPIYATIHEACYADGGATRWSSDRLFPEEFREQLWFTGEHIFRWMWDDYGALRQHAAAADILAEHMWPRLYDAEQLARNEVPAAAAVYYDDPYVLREYSMEAAAQIRGLRPWITNEYLHDGLRTGGADVLGRLFDLARGRA
ncbi:MAG TPA: alpha/beta fold hydrolase [Candidatus Binatia bacterium]|nr:alpha/beta fold hydrolase [Candidatus Binatia bacterium]